MAFYIRVAVLVCFIALLLGGCRGSVQVPLGEYQSLLPAAGWAWPTGDCANRGRSAYIGPDQSAAAWQLELAEVEEGLSLDQLITGSAGRIFLWIEANKPAPEADETRLYELLDGPQLQPAASFNSDLYPSRPGVGEDGTMYTVTHDFNTHQYWLVAFSPDSPGELWSTELEGRPQFMRGLPGGDLLVSGPVGYGDYLTMVHCYDQTGTLTWSAEVDAMDVSAPAITAGGIIYLTTSTPVFSGPADSYLVSLNPDGSSRWTYMLPPSDAELPPALGPDGTIYVTSLFEAGSPGIVFVNAITSQGEFKWRFGAEGGDTSHLAIAADGAVLFATHEVVGALDNDPDHPDTKVYRFYALAPDGTQRWSYETHASNWARPLTDPAGHVYLTLDRGGGVAAFDCASGEQLWTAETDSTTGQPLITTEGTLIVGSDDCIYGFGSQ